MEPIAGERTVVGVRPWLPWPLSRWRWWTEPVRAERLAALRIGLALVLLVDLVSCYLPQLHEFYGPDSLTRVGDRDVFGWYARAPRWNWSLLRGLGYPGNLTFSLLAWIGVSLWVLAGLGPRPAGRSTRHLRLALPVWIVATLMSLLGGWSYLRGLPANALDAIPNLEGVLDLVAAGVVWLTATAFLLLALRRRRWEASPDRLVMPLAHLAWVVATALLLLGIGRWYGAPLAPENPLALSWALGSWDESATALSLAMGVWIAATACLLLGAATRVSAVVVWVLSTSFANLNCNVDNAGDTIRGILLFYLMVSPCGAAWSVDAWLARRRGRRAGPVFIYPWVLRLVFVQMVLVYFLNGLYKLCGAEWREGLSLYYVMADLTLTRVSYTQFHLPLPVLQAMAYTVLTWEVTFPLTVSLRWTRPVALCFGALFHVGIWVTMELGGFAPYMLSMYLPLLPWERWVDRWRQRRAGPAPPSGRVERTGEAAPAVAVADNRETASGQFV